MISYPFFLFRLLNRSLDNLNVSATVEFFLVAFAHSADVGPVVASPGVAGVVAPLDDAVIACQTFWKLSHSNNLQVTRCQAWKLYLVYHQPPLTGSPPTLVPGMSHLVVPSSKTRRSSGFSKQDSGSVMSFSLILQREYSNQPMW